MKLLDSNIKLRRTSGKTVEIKTKAGLIKARTPIAEYTQHFGAWYCFGIEFLEQVKPIWRLPPLCKHLNPKRFVEFCWQGLRSKQVKLGFLPGDLSQKSILTCALYDALFEMLGLKKSKSTLTQYYWSGATGLHARPHAQRRFRDFGWVTKHNGWTNEDVFDCIGFNSHAVITGDITQIDLPKHQNSGLKHAVEVLKDIPEISRTLQLRMWFAIL